MQEAKGEEAERREFQRDTARNDKDRACSRTHREANGAELVGSFANLDGLALGDALDAHDGLHRRLHHHLHGVQLQGRRAVDESGKTVSGGSGDERAGRWARSRGARARADGLPRCFGAFECRSC